MKQIRNLANGFKKKKNHTGQGIIEYILLMAAVIVILLIFFSKTGIFQRSYNKVLLMQGDDMVNSARVIFDTSP